MGVLIYAHKSKKIICKHNVFYKERGTGAARTIVNIPDRLIRKKIQTNSGEPGTLANNVVSSSRKGPDGGSLPEYVPNIRVPLTSSSAFCIIYPTAPSRGARLE